MKKFLIWLSMIATIPMLVACGERAQIDPKDDPDVYCKRGTNPVGPPIYYPETSPRSEQRSMDSWEEWKTTAGYTIRIPAGVGGLSQWGKKCEMAAAIFEFKWVDGKLLSYYDLKTGHPRTEGIWVKYFVSFSPPIVNGIENYAFPKWRLVDAFKIQGHENIWILPYGDKPDPKYIPADRKNPKNFWPAIMLEDAKDPAGNGTVFHCDPMKFTKKNNQIYVEFVNQSKPSYCRGDVIFLFGSGGRLDILGGHFFDIAAPITNAVTTEIKSYIIKE